MANSFKTFGCILLLVAFCPAFLWAGAPLQFNIAISASGPVDTLSSGHEIAKRIRAELKQLEANGGLNGSDVNLVVVEDEVVVQGEVATSEQFEQLLGIAHRTPGAGKVRSESSAGDQTMPSLIPATDPLRDRVDELLPRGADKAILAPIPMQQPKSVLREVSNSVYGREEVSPTNAVAAARRGDAPLNANDRNIGREVARRLQDAKQDYGWENYGVSIDVQEGAVILGGTAGTKEQQRKTLDIVSSTPGVAEVIYDFQAGSAGTLSSTQIARTIRNQLEASAQLQDANIDVRVDNGVAWLRGVAAGTHDKELALSIASYTTGVEQVADEISLRGRAPLAPAPIRPAQELRTDHHVTFGVDDTYWDPDYGLHDVPLQDGLGGLIWGCSDECCGTGWYGSQRLWVRGEYLMWWAKGNQLPPLVTTSNAGTPRPRAGVLGLASTSTLLGDERVDGGTRNGARVTGVWWFDDSQLNGLEATWFSLDADEGDDTRFIGIGTGGAPILARPFFNVGTQLQDSQLVSFPNVVDGEISVGTSTEIQSAGILSRRHWRCGPRGRTDLLIGYRYMRFNDKLLIREMLASTDPGGLIAQGTTFDVFDQFDTDNNFHGVDLGVVSQFCRGPLTFETKAKLGVGGTFRELNINGGTTVTVPGVPSATGVGGLLALSSNIGEHSSTKFAVLPELNINLLYQHSPTLQFTLGYSVMGLTGVMRSGDQIDLAVDSTGLPTAGVAPGSAMAGRPAALSNGTSVWLQGLSLGLELRR